jgi:hypothetical protein
MHPIRQGDVLLIPVAHSESAVSLPEFGQKPPHLTLADLSGRRGDKTQAPER